VTPGGLTARRGATYDAAMWWVLFLVAPMDLAVLLLFPAVAGIVAVGGAGRAIRRRLHGAMISRFARAQGWTFEPRVSGARHALRGHACGALAADDGGRDLVEGTLHGRRFHALDYAGPRSGVETSRMGVDFAGLWGPAYGTAVVVDCDLPPGARTASARRGMRPWRVEFGARSAVAWCEGLRSPRDLIRAVDGLNAAIDGIIGRAAPAA
jgi:hypothetical protein